MPDVHTLAQRHDKGTTLVQIGQGALTLAAPELSAWWEGRSLFLLSSPQILRLHGERVRQLTGTAGRVFVLEGVPDGEAGKTVPVAHGVWEQMLDHGGKRDSRLLTLGGGSVGDLGGFVAGCFLRGIEYAQLPTTLLAQVDASVGGKTGVDLAFGKNTVGLFHQPYRVVAETEFLATLPREELRAGLVEVVKMAALLDPPLLDRVEERLDDLLAGDLDALAPVVAGAVAAKIRVVEDDPEEQDQRRLLNFGHTLAHALETVLGYQGLRHGEAVAYGMLFALRLAAAAGLGEDLRARLVPLLQRFELPVLPELSPEELCQAMSRDKKARESGLVWVLPVALGEGQMVQGIEPQEVIDELGRFLADPFA